MWDMLVGEINKSLFQIFAKKAKLEESYEPSFGKLS